MLFLHEVCKKRIARLLTRELEFCLCKRAKGKVQRWAFHRQPAESPRTGTSQDTMPSRRNEENVLTRAGARVQSGRRRNAQGRPLRGHPLVGPGHASAGSAEIVFIHLYAEIIAPRQQRRGARRCRPTKGIEHQLTRQRECANQRRQRDHRFLRVLFNSAKFRRRYDPMQWEPTEITIRKPDVQD